MRTPWLAVGGILVALVGLLFTLQGVGVVKGSPMTGTTLWSILGPIIIVIGLVVAALGLRRRQG